MKRLLISATLLILGLPVLAQTTGEYQEAIAEAKEIFAAFADENDIPGTAVAVGVKGEIVWSEGLGYADLEQQVRVKPDRTKFRIGSVSKPITAAALGILYEEGKIDLDVPIQTYVPDFPEKEFPITLRQLAGHTAGIRHYRGDEFLSSKHYPTVAEGLDIFKDDSLLFEPESDYSYSSYGWNLISAAIEGASGQAFLTYVQDFVFTPLGMYHSAADYTNRIVPDRSRFYVKDVNHGAIPAPFVDNSYKWAGGGFLASAEDLVRFGMAHLSEDLLKPETIEEFTTSQTLTDGSKTNYGIGWQSGEDEEGRAYFGHSGGSVGGITQLVIFPEQGIVVAVVTNVNPVQYDGAHLRIADCFMR